MNAGAISPALRSRRLFYKLAKPKSLRERRSYDRRKAVGCAVRTAFIKHAWFDRCARRTLRILLLSPFHEARLMALLLLVHSCGRGSVEALITIYKEYPGTTRFDNLRLRE